MADLTVMDDDLYLATLDVDEFYGSNSGFVCNRMVRTIKPL